MRSSAFVAVALCVAVLACLAPAAEANFANAVRSVFKVDERSSTSASIVTTSGQFRLFANAANNCSLDSDCGTHGTCRSGTGVRLCSCEAGWTTHYAGIADSAFVNPASGTVNPLAGYVGCNYEQKKQITAFLLHFFLGNWGAGHWYTGNYSMAGGQLGLILGVICITCAFTICATVGGKPSCSSLLSPFVLHFCLAFAPRYSFSNCPMFVPCAFAS
jgi:hypothetical protein